MKLITVSPRKYLEVIEKHCSIQFYNPNPTIFNQEPNFLANVIITVNGTNDECKTYWSLYEEEVAGEKIRYIKCITNNNEENNWYLNRNLLIVLYQKFGALLHPTFEDHDDLDNKLNIANLDDYVKSLPK